MRILGIWKPSTILFTHLVYICRQGNVEFIHFKPKQNSLEKLQGVQRNITVARQFKSRLWFLDSFETAVNFPSHAWYFKQFNQNILLVLFWDFNITKRIKNFVQISILFKQNQTFRNLNKINHISSNIESTKKQTIFSKCQD